MNVLASRSLRWLVVASCAFVLACDDSSTPSDATDTVTADDTAAPPEDAAADAAEPADTAVADTAAPDTVAPICEPVDPPCSDEQISALRFSDTADGGAITEEGETPGEFLTHIDATAGGFQGSLGYTYARFTDAGLEKVDISDEDSLESMDWDVAFRRFIIRFNSGVSGPSCVLAGRTSPATVWEELTALPASVTLREEQYFTGEACEFVPETSGLGSPLTITSSFWSYSGCVAMTGNIYVAALRDGRNVKLEVLSYYDPAVQQTCDQTDSAPAPNGSGNLRVRWAFID